jgi:DMSO/TMAO reductase YedYZ molybdopterin-dependent catalytic subunit
MRTRAFFRGALAGALITLSLAAVHAIATAWGGRSFVPFDLFDAVSRLLPGAWVTRGIELLVRLLTAVAPAGLSRHAKLAEHIAAITGFVAFGALAGGLLNAVRWRHRSRALIAGAVGGVAIGVAALDAMVVSTPQVASSLQRVWVLATFALWGVLLGWAALRLRGSLAPPEVQRLDRRRFLIRLAGFTASITVAGAWISWRNRRPLSPAEPPWSATHALPNAHATVQPVPGGRPEFTPLADHYRIDIDSMPMRIDASSWRLRVNGRVESPLALTLDELKARPAMDQFVTLSCISNPVGGDLIGTQRWTGVSLQQLLPDLHLKPDATHLKLIAADGYYEVLALQTVREDPRVMLTWAWDGLPLSAEHGFPLRIYIPDRYGMKQPKWIESIVVLDHWEPGYWVRRGWDKEAIMKTTSFIDTVDLFHAEPERAGARRVAVGGKAHAGSRGISRVELRVDDGPWTLADVRTPLSQTTWVVWRAELLLPQGHHTLTVRCFDGTGAMQPIEPAEPHPSGASGWQSHNA